MVSTYVYFAAQLADAFVGLKAALDHTDIVMVSMPRSPADVLSVPLEVSLPFARSEC